MRAPTLFCALCAALFCAETLPVHAEDNPAQAASRAALLQALQQPGSPQTNPPAAPPVARPHTPARSTPSTPSPAQPVAASVTAASSAPVSSAGDNAAQAAARAALLQNRPAVSVTNPNLAAAPARTGASAAPKTSGPPAVLAPANVGAPAAAVPMSLLPVPAPPLSADQVARLQQLDAKYSANQISPLDYFTQREAILKGQ